MHGAEHSRRDASSMYVRISSFIVDSKIRNSRVVIITRYSKTNSSSLHVVSIHHYERLIISLYRADERSYSK